jgi:hypothetical protein
VAEIRYAGTYTSPGNAIVTSIGSASGPPGGDNWQAVATLPGAQMPASATLHPALIVKGRIGTISRSGAVPQAGLVQVALGTSGGLISAHHVENLAVRHEESTVNSQLEGFQFCFMMVMQSSPSITDPTFGSTWNNLGGDDFTLWARSFWNGDPTTYAVQFEVSDVQWLWIDLDAVPAGDKLVEDYLPASPVVLSGTATTDLFQTTNQPGNSGEKWIHFNRLWYTPRAHGADAPLFRFGYAGAAFSGFVSKVPSGSQWGQNRSALFQTAMQNVTLQQGCFWYGVQPAGTFKPAVRAAVRYNGSPLAQTLVHRYTYVGLRLDNLLDVLARTEDFVANAAVNIENTVNPWPTVYVPLERPNNGLTANPTVFMHVLAQGQTGESYTCALSTNEAGNFYFGTGFIFVDAFRFEGMSSMAWTPSPFTPTMPDVQLRAHTVGGYGQINFLRNIRDLSLVTAYLIRDPSNLPTQPPTEPTPTVMEFQRESVAVGSLMPLLIAPDAVRQDEALEPESARIDGSTGYSRTWPLFGRPRRAFTLQWTLASTTALEAFLIANGVFAWRPRPDAADVALFQLEPFEVRWHDKGISVVTVRCVELVWTGTN